jgi:hypothetical protein
VLEILGALVQAQPVAKTPENDRLQALSRINNNLVHLMNKLGMDTGYYAGVQAAKRSAVLGAAAQIARRATVDTLIANIDQNMRRLMHKMGMDASGSTAGVQTARRSFADSHVLGAAMEVLLDQIYGEDEE